MYHIWEKVLNSFATHKQKVLISLKNARVWMSMSFTFNERSLTKENWKKINWKPLAICWLTSSYFELGWNWRLWLKCVQVMIRVAQSLVGLILWSFHLHQLADGKQLAPFQLFLSSLERAFLLLIFFSIAGMGCKLVD